LKKGIILAAGRGSRMGELTKESPKCFSTVSGKRLIEWQLEAFKLAGVEQVAIVTGYKKEMFTYPLTFFHNNSWASSNMVRSLLKAADWLNNHTCIISYSDIIYPKEVIQSISDNCYDIAITYDPAWLALWKKRFDNPLSDAETFIQKKGILVEIGQQTSDTQNIQGQYMGVIKTTPKGWQKIEHYLNTLSDTKIDGLDMTGLFSQLISLGTIINTVPIDSAWFEIDSASDRLIAEDYFACHSSF
jgi:choline kinase